MSTDFAISQTAQGTGFGVNTKDVLDVNCANGEVINELRVLTDNNNIPFIKDISFTCTDGRVVTGAARQVTTPGNIVIRGKIANANIATYRNTLTRGTQNTYLIGTGGNGINSYGKGSEFVRVINASCPSGTYVSGLSRMKVNKDSITQLGYNCTPYAEEFCLNNIDDPRCRSRRSNLPASCTKNFTSSCKASADQLDETIISSYCSTHLDDPFCGCYAVAPEKLPKNIAPQCWSKTCALPAAYRPRASRSATCTSRTLCKQDYTGGQIGQFSPTFITFKDCTETTPVVIPATPGVPPTPVVVVVPIDVIESQLAAINYSSEEIQSNKEKLKGVESAKIINDLLISAARFKQPEFQNAVNALITQFDKAVSVLSIAVAVDMEFNQLKKDFSKLQEQIITYKDAVAKANIDLGNLDMARSLSLNIQRDAEASMQRSIQAKATARTPAEITQAQLLEEKALHDKKIYEDGQALIIQNTNIQNAIRTQALADINQGKDTMNNLNASLSTISKKLIESIIEFRKERQIMEDISKSVLDKQKILQRQADEKDAAQAAEQRAATQAVIDAAAQAAASATNEEQRIQAAVAQAAAQAFADANIRAAQAEAARAAAEDARISQERADAKAIADAIAAHAAADAQTANANAQVEAARVAQVAADAKKAEAVAAQNAVIAAITAATTQAEVNAANQRKADADAKTRDAAAAQAAVTLAASTAAANQAKAIEDAKAAAQAHADAQAAADAKKAAADKKELDLQNAIRVANQTLVETAQASSTAATTPEQIAAANRARDAAASVAARAAAAEEAAAAVARAIAARAVDVTSSTPSTPSTQSTQSTQSTSSTSGIPTWALILIILVIIAIFVTIGYFIFKKPTNTQTDTYI